MKPMYKKIVKLWPCKKATAFVPCKSGEFMAQGLATLKITDVSEYEKVQLTNTDVKNDNIVLMAELKESYEQ